MAIVAPKGRQHLSADALFRLVRRGFATVPDYRQSDTDMALPDALMSACALFSLKSPSLLAFDKERAEGNVDTIDGIERVPCDTHMRQILRNGSITYVHQMWGAALIHPDMRAVLPLMPEPIVKPDGTDNNDGARHAAKRLVAKLRQDHPHLQFIVTEDRLRAHAPHLQTLQDHHLHDLLGVQAGAHAWLFTQVQEAEQAGRVTYAERHDRAAGVVQRLRCVNAVPLNESHTDVRVNFIESWERGDDTVQHCSWVTDVRVSQRHVYRLMRGDEPDGRSNTRPSRR